MSIQLNLVDLKLNEHGFYEYDFYPDRKFDGIEYCILYSGECWGNIQYIEFFDECDAKNIQVICFTSINFFPICSYISHKCILMVNEKLGLDKTDGKTYNNINIGLFKNKYLFSNIFNGSDRKYRHQPYGYPTHMSRNLSDNLYNKPLYITKEAYHLFQNCKIFNEKQVIIMYPFARGYYQGLVRKLLSEKVPIIGQEGIFQQEILRYSTSNNFLSFQILSSLYYGTGYIGLGGAASVLSMAFPINCLFLCDHNSNVGENIITTKAFYNKKMYNIFTNGFSLIIGIAYSDGFLADSWRYSCLKHSINNIKDCKIPEVTILT